MKDYIIQPEKKIQVCESCTVAVVGGGVAGIAAALSAAREGADVLLLEQQYSLGGLATLGLVTIYLPLCDGIGHQLSFGIAEELLSLSVSAEKSFSPRAEWERELAEKDAQSSGRYMCQFNPVSFSLTAERLLKAEGVRIIYGVRICDALVENGRITTLLAEGCDGRFAIRVKTVIDTAGDAPVLRMAGERTETYKEQNILAAWYYSVENGRLIRTILGAADSATEDEKLNAGNGLGGGKRYSGTDYKSVNEFTQDSHEYLWQHFNSKGEADENHSLAMMAGIPQLRMTRRLSGISTIDEPEADIHYDDSIGVIANWKKRGPAYELPLSCLHGDRIRNLITAGRSISATDTMWDNTRVIPACAVTGEAAGIAAALTDDFTADIYPVVAQRLRAREIPLHINELR